MSIYECSFPGCGRRFKDESVLAGHMRRRHKEELPRAPDPEIVQVEPEIDHHEEPVKTEKSGPQEDEDKFLARLKSELKKLDVPEETPITMNDILESQKRLTPQYLLERSGCSELEEISQLILREEKLYHFDDTSELTMDQLPSLEYLAISHNKLTLVNGIGKLVNLVELNINFNLVEDITPLNECLNLEKLYASNNKIKHISGIRDLTRLKCLGLYRNKIKDFDATVKVLSGFPDLKELDLDGNECTKRFTYKYDLLYSVKVEKLDGERINPIDYELAKSFKKEKPAQAGKEEEEEIVSAGPQRPGTAPGRVRPDSTFAKKLKEGMHFGSKNLMNIPENVNSERVAELEQELEGLRETVNQLEVELEQAKGREALLKLDNEKLTNQMSIMKVEASNAYLLLDTNQQLTKELQALKAISSEKDEHRDLKQENFLLHEQIMELVKEKNELKAKLDKKYAVDEAQDKAERVPRKTEVLRITTRQSSTSQDIKEMKNEKPKTINVKSGQMSPSFRINAGASPRVLLRGTSSESMRSDQKAATVAPQKGSARKVVKVLPPRQTSATKEREKPREEEPEEELSDREIEDLLIRSSLQISALRSELRNFDFKAIEQEARKINYTYDDAEDIEGDENDEIETRATSGQSKRFI